MILPPTYVHCLRNGVVSRGRRNTRTTVPSPGIPKASNVREHKCKEKASCLGKIELQTPKDGPFETYCQIN